MLDGDDGVPERDQPVEGLEEPLDILRVEPRRRLVEEEERAARRRRPDLQERRELQPLRLASGERRRRLAELHVAETDLDERRQPLADARLFREEPSGVRDRHVEHVADALSPVADGEHAALEPPPVARLAAHGHVGQELHVDRLPAGALARLAAAAGRVEGEVPRRDPAGDRAPALREKLPDVVPRLHVRDGVRARGAAERALVDEEDVGDGPRGPSTRSCSPTSRDDALHAPGVGVVEDVADERRLSRSRRRRRPRRAVRAESAPSGPGGCARAPRRP